VSDDRPLFGESLFVPLLLVIPIVVLAIGAIWAVRARPSVVATLQRGESEGRAFAHVNKQTVSTCLDGAIATLDRLDQPIEPGAAAFFEACLSESGLPKIGGAKQSAPTRALLEAWSRDECAARGRSGDKHCVLLLQLANVDPCAPMFAGQTTAAAPWQCR
jgi:hypothetical protein